MKMIYSKKTSEGEDFSEEAGVSAETTCCHKGHKCHKIVPIVVLLAIILGGAWCAYVYSSSKIASVSSKEWQAVFLVNGQVYFGKVNAVSPKTVALVDIYYLQVVQKPLQQTQQGGTPTAADQAASQELTLIKLGNELHGPTDAMTINRDQILLTEKLKKDSKVVQAINTYLQDQKKK